VTGRNQGDVRRTTRARDVTLAVHDGHHAVRLRLTSGRGSRLVMTRRQAGCALPVTARSLAFWEHSSAGLSVLAAYRTAQGWTAPRTLARIPPSRSWRHPTVRLPAAPPGAVRMSIGFAVIRVGAATVDTVTLQPPPVQPPSVQPVSVTPPTAPAGLVTNEFAYWNPGLSSSVSSPDWEMTSGSLFSTGTALWTGRPDTVNPDATSSNGTDSAVFRLTTKRADFGNVAVTFTLHNNGLTSTASTPPVDWDGVHIFLRYQSEYQLYYASVNRRDGHVVLKKKCPGGPSNGGTYYELAPEISGHPIPFGTDQAVGASAVNNADGSVTLSLSLDGTTVVSATDNGVGCAPLTSAGKVGIRGDNDDFTFSAFSVTAA
jgi:hypothetical protein